MVKKRGGEISMLAHPGQKADYAPVTEWDGGKKNFIQKWSLFKEIQLLLEHYAI